MDTMLVVHEQPSEAPPQRHRWWMAAVLVVLALAGLVGIVVALTDGDGVDDRPVSAPELRWFVGDGTLHAYAATEQRPQGTPDMWPGEGSAKFALYGTHDDPSQPTISLGVGEQLNTDGFAFLTGVEGLQRAEVDGVEAACGTWVYGFQLCLAEVDGTFVQAHARGIDVPALVEIMTHATVERGGPVLDPTTLPGGMSLLHAWDDRPPGAISAIDPEAITTSVTFDDPDDPTFSAGMSVGWADQQELAAAFESSDYAAHEIDGITYYVSVEPFFGGSMVVWEQDGRAFDLSVKGTPEVALALARSARPATDTEWAAAEVAAPLPRQVVPVTSAGGASTTVVVAKPTMATLPEGAIVSDVPVELQIAGSADQATSFTSALPDGTSSTMSALVVADTAFISFDGGAQSGWGLQAPLLFDYATPEGLMGLLVIDQKGTAAQLRVTRSNGDRYVMDLVESPENPGITVAYLVVPAGELVTADVVDGFGTVLDRIGG